MAPKKKTDTRAATDRARAKWEREAAKDARNATATSIGRDVSRAAASGGARQSAIESRGRPTPTRSPWLSRVAGGAPGATSGASPVGRSLGELFGEIQAKHQGGMFSKLGGVTGALGQNAGGQVGSAAGQAAIQSVSSLLEKIQAGLPGVPGAPGGISPTLVDIAATLAPFGAARDNVNAQAEKNRAMIGTLASQGMEDNADVAAAEQQRLASMAQLLQTRQKQNMSGATADGSASLTDLRAQGVDPALQAEMGAQILAQRQDAGNASTGALDMVANQKTTEGIEAKRNDRQVQASQSNATGQLDASLFEAIVGLNAQEQKARTEAEQFNAQSTAQANEANFAGQQQSYEAQMARMQDLMQLPGAVGQAAAESGALAFPRRDQAMNTIMSTMNTSSADGVGFGMLQAIQAADNPDDAMQSVVNHITDINARRKKNEANPISPDMGNIRRLISDYYAQDGSLTNDGFAQLKRAFLG